jgi:glucosylceramidase
VVAVLATALTLGRGAPTGVRVWLTDPASAPTSGDFDSQSRAGLAWGVDSGASLLTIDVRDSIQYQRMDGFGASLTDSSAWLISQSPQRDLIMQRLFSRNAGIGISFLRQPIGASDYTVGPAYTYDDAPVGQPDSSLSRFSVAHDDTYIIPLLRRALAINPSLKFMASPWSPPAWMKRSTTGSLPGLNGGSVDPIYFDAYARYLVKFVQAYGARGIPIFAITPQNEPTADLWGAPWANMSAEDETAFVRDYLGPQLSKYPGTRILVSDDAMPSMAKHVERIASDPNAWRYVGGTATHCYFGGLDRMTFPGKDAYVTECSNGIGTTTYNGRTIDAIIDSARGGAKAVVLWNIALDQQLGPIPAAPYGCNFVDIATYGACTAMVTIPDGPAPAYRPTGQPAKYELDYYHLGHASKFVLPGAVRIDSSSLDPLGIKNVAFKNPDGSLVLLVHNTSAQPQLIKVRQAGRAFEYTLPANAVATFSWS